MTPPTNPSRSTGTPAQGLQLRCTECDESYFLLTPHHAYTQAVLLAKSLTGRVTMSSESLPGPLPASACHRAPIEVRLLGYGPDARFDTSEDH